MRIATRLLVRPGKPSLRVTLTAASCLLLIPLLPLIHQAIVLVTAFTLRTVASSLLVKDLLTGAGLDPVYASVFNRTMGNIEAKGLAVAGPLGDGLHQLAPGFFEPPGRVMPGFWATALVGDGVSLLASAIASAASNGILLVIGLALLLFYLRRPHGSGRGLYWALAFLSVMFQARGMVGLFRRNFSAQDLEIMGLSQFFTKVFPLDAPLYRQIASGPLEVLAPYLIPSLVVLAVYGTFLALLFFRVRPPWGPARNALLLGQRLLGWLSIFPRSRLGYQSLAGAFLIVVATTSPFLLPAKADYDYAIEAEADADTADARADTSPFAETAPAKEFVAGPSKAVIAGSNYSYSYTVNGRPVRIRGIGYNAMYSELPAKERAARYDWDFAEMKAAGVNTILGWGPQNFDDLTLEKAQEYGLGVVMPYRLLGNVDYTNPAYTDGVMRDVTEWVQRFKGYPALRMWGIGNEVIHYIHSPSDPRAKSFAEFYVKLADAVHAIDPDHPVVYRDAEDVYAGPIRDALKKDGIRRPWFVYGMNFFTNRICEALPVWPGKEMDVALIISEFAPSGLSPQDRPKGYLHMLRCINKQYPAVLGAFAYVWTTDGPEAIDRTMGLVDGRGQPVDRSLWALGGAFHRGGD